MYTSPRKNKRAWTCRYIEQQAADGKSQQWYADDQSSIPPTKTPSPRPGKTALEETIIADLKTFFIKNPSPERSNGKLSDDVKEVTKVEMRNDLSKRQLFYVLLVSLLDEKTPSVKQVLELRAPLFKTASIYIGWTRRCDGIVRITWDIFCFIVCQDSSGPANLA